MIRLIGAILGLVVTASPALACPKPAKALLAHTCWNDAVVEILILPEQIDALSPDGTAITVTGTYTGRGKSASGGPKPVGLFLHRGTVLNGQIGKMDGVLLVVPGEMPTIQHRERIAIGDYRFDLTDPASRKNFIVLSGRLGLSMFQSHLLIHRGKMDVRPLKSARKAVRRLLVQDKDGLALVQTPFPMTLFAAANWADKTFRPIMALNLDMGTYNYCMRHDAGARKKCGRVNAAGVAILSNLLRFHARPGE